MFHRRFPAVPLMLTFVFMLGVAAPAPTLGSGPPPFPPPPRMIVERDLVYGEHESHRLDVYRPAKAKGAPIIFLVHGRDWLTSDKSSPSTVRGKTARWVARGFIVVAANYRQSAYPDTPAQVDDLARAVAFAQKRARRWGGDPDGLLLMGHYAGGHLAALLTVAPGRIVEAGGRKPLGAVLLDAVAYDVEAFMARDGANAYESVFGSNPVYWSWTISPIGLIGGETLPLAAVCSQRRAGACEDASAFVERATAAGVRAELLRMDTTTDALDAELGAESDYTLRIEGFMRRLDRRLERRL